MKEIALIGFGGPVFANTLSKLLEEGQTVQVLTTHPTHVMLNNTALTVSHLDLDNRLHLIDSLQNYDNLIIALETDLTDAQLNNLILKHYNGLITAAIEAGVNRLIVVGGKESQAFYTTDLKRLDNIDWVFISTEGDYRLHAYQQTVRPTVHHAVYM